MTSNVKMILDEVNARIKLAEAKTAEDPSNFDSFPGAENDKAVPAEMKNPDPEVKEEGPASRTEVAGATPGSDAPVQQDHLYEADEPVLTPEKKPAETADANAKVAAENPEVAKVAADILNILKTNMKTPEPEKKAEKNMISLESKILDKIASVRTNKQAEANETSAMLKFAEEYNRGVNDARALLQKLAQEMAAEEAGAAGAADAAAAAGAADAEAAIANAAAEEAAAGEALDGAEDPVTPEEVVEAVQELVQEGQISEEDAATVISQIGEPEGDLGGGEDVTEDQIAEGIAQAIESGEISEEEAQQLVQELVDAGADESVQEQLAAEEAGAADAAAAAGAADAEAAIADAQKTAAAQDEVTRYQQGFIQKCAEYGVEPQRLAQYIQARTAGTY